MANSSDESFDPTDPIETSPSGQPIYRYDKVKRKPFEVGLPGDHAIAVAKHLERHLGPSSSVLHEIMSDLIHLDVYCFEPTSKRPFYVYATGGMSDRAMHLPAKAKEAGASPFAELLICLPPDWAWKGKTGEVTPVKSDSPEARAYWPVGWMKFLARFVHQNDTYFGQGHPIPNGDPPASLDGRPDGFVAGMILQSMKVSKNLWTLQLRDERVDFFAVWPLFIEELQYKLKHGMNALLDRFEEHQVTDLYDLSRANAVTGKRSSFDPPVGAGESRLRRFWPFGRGSA